MTEQQQTFTQRMRSRLEVLLAITFLLILFLSALATFIKDQAALGRWLNSHEVILSAIGLGECALLLLWMCLGGQKSHLWDWLPPFCFFPKVIWVRWLIVVALIGGTIAGIVARP
jgi:hypothetical protein